MTVRHCLHRHLLLPAYETVWQRRKGFRYWRELERTQWLSRASLEQLQFEALKRLLRHAFENCPYYREAWAENDLDPSSLKATDDFARWPLIDRTTVQENRFRMRASGIGPLMHKATGGSSGVPLEFDLDLGSHDRRTAAWHRGYNWANGGPGTRQLYFWGVPLGERSVTARCKDAAYHALYRRRVLKSFELNERSAADYLSRLNRYRPDVVVAYTNPLYTFARMIDERGLAAWSPRAIIVGAEKLHDFQRRLIEKVFQAPVFETYGSREFMLMGAECDRHEGLHLTCENLLVEVVDDDGQPTPEGQEGNVAVTDLYNYGMPFVRYLNGDRAVAGWGDCSCGRGLPLLKKVVGRRLDVVTTPDGRQIAGEFFPHLMKDFAGVRQFQVIQDAPDDVRVLIVAGPTWNAAEARLLQSQIQEVLGDSIRMHLERVPDISLTRSGKLHVVVNRCIASGDAPAVAGPAFAHAVG